MTVLATAGHVDHGKSTFVNFLTGQETDRLKEEKARGLTINLGYTYFKYNNRTISIVDVPGHIDYFKNTIAGFSNVDGIIFCVDSVQGWSKQSEEHFQAIKNLEINEIFFVLTKTDLLERPADKDFIKNKLKSEESIRFVIEEFSNKSGDIYLFHKKIESFFKTDTSENPNSLWIDRSFTKEGIGKVVTGTAPKTFDLENIYIARTNNLLDIKEIRSTEHKVNQINSTSRIALSIRKSNQDSIKRGDLLTNEIVYSGRYIFAFVNESEFNFDQKGNNRIFIGTTNQVVKKIKIVNTSESNLVFIELSENIPILENQKILIQNINSNNFIGGKIILSSDNKNLVRKFLRQTRKDENINLEEAFTLIPENLKNDSNEYIKIDNRFISKGYLGTIKKNIKENLERINTVGVKSYFYNELFIEERLLKKFIDSIEGFNIINNQLSVEKNKDIDIDLYQNILNEMSINLSVNSVDLNEYDKESVKELFINEYLFRLNKSLIISKEHLPRLLKVLKNLPEVFNVSEFKEESGLSRKFAIPYLEFADKCSFTSKIDSSGKRKRLI